MLKDNQEQNETPLYNLTLLKDLLKIQILKIEMHIRLHGSCGTDLGTPPPHFYVLRLRLACKSNDKTINLNSYLVLHVMKYIYAIL